MSAYNFPAARRITANNLPLPKALQASENSEPGVEVNVDDLKADDILGGVMKRSRVATHTAIPTSNDGHGTLPLADMPGIGIVLPGGMNMYYIDIAPKTESVLHRTTSTDYIIVISGNLSLDTPGAEPYSIEGGKPDIAKRVETVAKPGDIVMQRGMMHALSNRTDEWVRVLAIVLASEPNKVPVEGTDAKRELADAWLA